jgi:hypothetical protein
MTRGGGSSIAGGVWHSWQLWEAGQIELDRLYGNAVETTGRSKQKQTTAPSDADRPELRVRGDAA